MALGLQGGGTLERMIVSRWDRGNTGLYGRYLDWPRPLGQMWFSLKAEMLEGEVTVTSFSQQGRWHALLCSVKCLGIGYAIEVRVPCYYTTNKQAV